MDSTPQNAINKPQYILRACLFVGLGWILLHGFILYWYNVAYPMIIPDAVLSGVCIALACFVITNSLHFYQPGNQRSSYLLIWVVALNILVWVLVRFTLLWMFPDPDYRTFLDYSLPLRFILGSLAVGWIAMMHVLWNTQQTQAEQEKRKTEAEKLAREAELFNLRQQLQPHFLFNSLNSIIALIGSKPEEARNMVFQLSDFLRGTLRKDDQQLIPLKEELDHLALYLDIEKVRFGHRLNVDITQNDPAVLQDKLPAMILQPLLENAIKHGLYDTTGAVHIQIHALRQEYLLKVRIVNPFDPSGKVQKKSTGFGLRSVQRRLFLIYGRNDLLQTQSKDAIFTTEISIPQL